MYRRRVPQQGGYQQRRSFGGGRFKMMLMIGLAMAAFQAFKYYTNTQVNPLTGEDQRVQWTTEEEISLGLQSAPQMAQQHGGLHADQRARDFVRQVGERLVDNTIARQSGYPYDFHLLADE